MGEKKRRKWRTGFPSVQCNASASAPTQSTPWTAVLRYSENILYRKKHGFHAMYVLFIFWYLPSVRVLWEKKQFIINPQHTSGFPGFALTRWHETYLIWWTSDPLFSQLCSIFMFLEQDYSLPLHVCLWEPFITLTETCLHQNKWRQLNPSFIVITDFSQCWFLLCFISSAMDKGTRAAFRVFSRRTSSLIHFLLL